MNFVFIMTDTQNQDMVGAYGNPAVETPNLDALAGDGIRFDCAYTTCPLCTPARGGIFSGLYPPVNGADLNNVAPFGHVALMGEIFRHYGYRAAYTGKWHLDGSAYFGDGEPGGGFEEDWWYDGKCYLMDLPEAMRKRYGKCSSSEQLREYGFTEENIWGHRVADKAIEFLEGIGDESFVLACSFDEPHGPFFAPAEYWERFSDFKIPKRPNLGVVTDDMPTLQKIHADKHQHTDWETFIDGEWLKRWYACNSYIDYEIGRVIDVVNRLHRDDTVVIYTSDHGSQTGSHALTGKGPMMYEETCKIPFIVRMPSGPRGVACDKLVSHIDILPTMLDLAGIEQPEALNGVSLAPLLADPARKVRDYALITFTRFAINHDSFGEFYPIRCATDGRYKLAINLFETDELYDLETDPYEMSNLINKPETSEIRNQLHDWLLDEMDRVRDPYRSFRWGNRQWRNVRKAFYHDGKCRAKPKGFPFQATTLP